MHFSTLIVAETPWWIGLSVTVFMVLSYLYTTYIEYVAKKQADAEDAARKQTAYNNPERAGNPSGFPSQTVVVNRDLAEALGRRNQGDIVHLPTPPPRRRVEPPAYNTPPPFRRPSQEPPPFSRTPSPLAPAPASAAPAFPSAGTQAGSQTEALSRGVGPVTAPPIGSTHVNAQPSMILTELDRLTALTKRAQQQQPYGTTPAGSVAAAKISASSSIGKPGQGLGALLADRNALRHAFILKEVLGTPRGLSSDLY